MNCSPPTPHRVPPHCSAILLFFGKCLPLSKQIQIKMIMVEIISIDSKTTMVKARHVVKKQYEQ
jgi:hypothetical protein